MFALFLCEKNSKFVKISAFFIEFPEKLNNMGIFKEFLNCKREKLSKLTFSGREELEFSASGPYVHDL